MKTINKKGIEIKIYSSAKEISIGRYSDFQKYLMMDVSVESLETNIKKSKAYLEEGQKDDAIIELENSLNAILSLKSGVGILTYAFAVLVAEIGGIMASDTTIEGLNAVIERLNELGLTQGDLESEIEELKKKLN